MYLIHDKSKNRVILQQPKINRMNFSKFEVPYPIDHAYQKRVAYFSMGLPYISH
jgi:hypothetical protein